MPDYTKDGRPLTPNEQAIHDAIGYDPVRVSMPGGIGSLAYRTADDMDNLIAKLAPLLDAKDAELATAWSEGHGQALANIAWPKERKSNPYRSEDWEK